MSTRALHRKLLLSTATLIGALAGYGSRAYGQQVCPQQGATTTFLCDGFSDDTQDLTVGTTGVNNPNVITELVEKLLLASCLPPHHHPVSADVASKKRNHRSHKISTDFCNTIGH